MGKPIKKTTAENSGFEKLYLRNYITGGFFI